jgi:hypothetical protein
MPPVLPRPKNTSQNSLRHSNVGANRVTSPATGYFYVRKSDNKAGVLRTNAAEDPRVTIQVFVVLRDAKTLGRSTALRRTDELLATLKLLRRS